MKHRKKIPLVPRSASGKTKVASQEVRQTILDPKNPYSGMYVICPIKSGEVKRAGRVGRRVPAISCYLHSQGLVLSPASLGLFEDTCLGCNDWKKQAEAILFEKNRKPRKKIVKSGKRGRKRIEKKKNKKVRKEIQKTTNKKKRSNVKHRKKIPVR